MLVSRLKEEAPFFRRGTDSQLLVCRLGYLVMGIAVYSMFVQLHWSLESREPCVAN